MQARIAARQHAASGRRSLLPAPMLLLQSLQLRFVLQVTGAIICFATYKGAHTRNGAFWHGLDCVPYGFCRVDLVLSARLLARCFRALCAGRCSPSGSNDFLCLFCPRARLRRAACVTKPSSSRFLPTLCVLSVKKTLTTKSSPFKWRLGKQIVTTELMDSPLMRVWISLGETAWSWRP